MHIMQVHVHVKPEHVDAFIQATKENATNSLKEPAIARFDVLQQSDDPTRFVLVEVYRNLEGTVKHKETTHYHAWLARVTDMLAEPRTRAMYNNIFPDDRGW
jgi:autoinducer 2-degrading protein